MKTRKVRTTNRYRYNPGTASKKQSTERREREKEREKERELLKGLGGESKVGVEMLLAAAAAAEQREEDDKQERLLEEYNADQLRILNAPGGSVSEVAAPLPVPKPQYEAYLDAIDEDLAERERIKEEKDLNMVSQDFLKALGTTAATKSDGGRRRTRKSRRRSASRRQTRKSRRRSASRRRSRRSRH